MNAYQICYDLINTYIYGGTVVDGTFNDLVCTQLSTIGCVFCFAIPFYVAYRILKSIG